MNIAEYDIAQAWNNFCEREGFDIRFLELGRVFISDRTKDDCEFKQYAYLRSTRFHPRIKLANATVNVNRDLWKYWRKQNGYVW